MTSDRPLDLDRYRVRPGTVVDLDDLPTDEDGGYSKHEGKELTKAPLYYYGMTLG